MDKAQAEKLDQIHAVNDNIASLTDQRDILKEQLEKANGKLEAMRVDLGQKSLKVKGRENVGAKEDMELDREFAKIFAEKERKRKEVDDSIRGSLTKLLRNGESLIPGQKAAQEEIETTAVHTVKVKYIRAYKDGDSEEKYKNSETSESTFRIRESTTFQELKIAACNLWKIDNEDKVSLRCTNLASVQVFDDKDMIIEGLEDKGDKLDEKDAESKIKCLNKVSKAIIDHTIYPEFLLVQNNIKAEDLFVDMNHYFVTDTQANQFKDNEQQKGPKKLSKQANGKYFEKMIDYYPGLKKYMIEQPDDEDEDEDAEEKRERLAKVRERETSCCTFFILIVIFALTISVIRFRRNVPESFWIQSGIHAHLLEEYEPDNNFFDIKSNDDMDQFFLNTVPSVIFLNPITTNSFSENAKFIGKARLRQVRTDTFDCEREDDYELEEDGLAWYYKEYSKDTRQEHDIEGGLEPWNEFREGPDDYSVIKGEFSDYDGSGYWKDFSHDITTIDFIEQYIEMMENNWIQDDTRAVILSFTIFIPSEEQWISNIVLIELSTSGGIHPSLMTSRVFRPDLFETTQDKILQGIDAFRFFLSFYILVLLIRKAKDRPGWKAKLATFLSFSGLLDVLFVVCSICGFAISYNIDEDGEELYNDTGHVDVLAISIDYSVSIIFNAICLLLLLLRIIQVFRLNRNINIILMTIENAAMNVIIYIIILVPIFIGFTMVSMTIWGMAHRDFSNFSRALLSNLYFAIGNSDIEGMLRVNRLWGMAYILVYFFCMIFFLLSVFMGLYMDSYRIVMLQMPAENEEDKWNCKKFTAWFFGCCKRKPKTGEEYKKTKKGADDDEEELINPFAKKAAVPDNRD